MTTLPAPDPLLTHRVEQVRYELLGRDDSIRGPLLGVQRGSGDVAWTAGAQVRGRASLTLDEQTSQVVDYLADRVRVWWQLLDRAGALIMEWPLITGVITAAPLTVSETGRTRRLELLDKTTLIAQAKTAGHYAIPAGTVITTTVRGLLTALGQTRLAITDSPKAIAAGMVWEPGTSWLTAINEMLDAIGYGSLWCDGLGVFQVQPYVRPAARTPVRRFTAEGGLAIHSPRWERDEDVHGIPNQVYMWTRPTQDVAGLKATAYNLDPASPTSYPRRGFWVDHVEVVEAADQATLDEMARRRLIELTSATATLTVSHAPVPDVQVHSAVRFESMGHAATATVQSMRLPLRPGAQVSATWVEVVDL